MRNRLLACAALFVPLLVSTAAHASIVTYATRGAFTAATTSLTVEGFANITTPTSNGIGSVGFGSTFSRNGLTITDGGIANSVLTALDNTYLNGGNQIRNRFGVAAGTVLDASFGDITLTFGGPVNAFGIDLATIARGFVGNSSTTFSFLIDGVSAGTFAYSGSSGFGFLGFTSTTSFSSVTIVNGSHASDDLFDNVSFQAAPRVAVPEPETLALLGLGLVGIAFARRRKRA
jgi:hypothetical protein